MVSVCLAWVVVVWGVRVGVRVDFIQTPSVPVGVPDGGGPLDQWLDIMVSVLIALC